MKVMKVIIVILFSISLYSSLNAIEIDSKGLILGLNYTKLWGNVQDGSDYTPGFTIGGYVNKRINNWLVIQPEVHLSSKIVYKNGTERLMLDNDMDGLYDEDEYDLIDNDMYGLVDEDRQEIEFEGGIFNYLNILTRYNEFIKKLPVWNGIGFILIKNSSFGVKSEHVLVYQSEGEMGEK